MATKKNSPPESFQAIRSFAWQKFMNQVSHDWPEAQGQLRSAVTTFADSKKQNQSILAKAYIKIEKEYLEKVTPAYHEYLETLCLAFMCEKLEDAKEESKIFKIRKAIENIKANPDKSPGRKKAPKKKNLKLSPEFVDEMDKKHNIKTSKKDKKRLTGGSKK